MLVNVSHSNELDELDRAMAIFAQAHPEVIRVRLFGSGARGEATFESDVDIIVSLAPGSLPRGLAGFAFLDDLEKDLSMHLGRPVNLTEQGAVEDAIRIGNNALPRSVVRDGRLIYELEPEAI